MFSVTPEIWAEQHTKSPGESFGNFQEI